MAAVKGIRSDLTQSLGKFNILQICTQRKRALSDHGDRRRQKNTADLCHGERFVSNGGDVFRHGKRLILLADPESFQGADTLIFQQNAVFYFESHSRAS